jgi:hypothetical protein
MYSLFRLLFNAAYWRFVCRKATWFEARLSLKRAHKDRRARKHLLKLIGFLLIPVFCAVYLIWLIGSGAILIVPFVVPVIWWLGRRQKQEAVPLRITPSPEPIVRVASKAERRALRVFFGELAILHAVMVDRAVSESFLSRKTLPEGFACTSRRIHLDLLKRTGIWDKLSRADRSAMMLPDGHWEEARIGRASSSLEPLLLLRWILRLDYYLPSIGRQLPATVQMANEIVQAPQKVLEGAELIDVSDIEITNDGAREFYARCLAESINKGYIDDMDEESTQWAREVSTRLSGKQHEDLVLGDRLISEASKEEVLSATFASRRRMMYLTWAMEVVGSGKVPEISVSVFEETEIAHGETA